MRGRPIELEPGTPLGDAVTRARAAVARGDAAGADAAYHEAVELTATDADPARWLALTVDHVAALFRLQRLSRARDRCDRYLRDAEARRLGAASVSLQLLRAEIRSSMGDRSGADADLAVIRTALDGQAGSLTAHEQAVYQRLEGLSAAAQGYHGKAERHLREAARIFREVGEQHGVGAVNRDWHRIAVRHGDEDALSRELDGPPPQTVADHLLRARALRRQQRYEEAIGVLEDALALDIDPPLRFPVLYELAVLLRLIADDKAADRLLPSLQEAAASSADPVASAEMVDRLAGAGAPGGEADTTFDQVLQRARRLIAGRQLDEAERLVIELRSRAKLGHEFAAWHLAAGELEYASGDLTQAVAHLREAAHHAAPAWLEVRVRALRLLGRAHYQLGNGDQAAEHWAEAHHLEEQIAGRQITDATRVRMLHAVADEHDERIRAAAAQLAQRGPDAAAAVVVAMEAARGAAILGRILPGGAFPRNLPSPGDHQGAWRWVNRMTNGFPRSQVAWLLHSTPERVHHAVIGRGLLSHASVPCARHDLEEAIDQLAACWEHEALLEESMRWGDFDRLLAEIASGIGLDAVIPALPPHVSRIAVVAGGALSTLPLAAMTVPGETEPIGLTYALSDLPCLHARRPLRRRSLHLRGDKRLLISPPAGTLTAAARSRADTVCEGEQATPAALRAALETRRHRRVRIDTHGEHDPRYPGRSWLQLAADESDGRLMADELQEMDLSSCGTLVLGACESGMAKRIGRDERIGFVRAAFHAGAAAVVAARWVAEDRAAAAVLDAFDRYSRYSRVTSRCSAPSSASAQTGGRSPPTRPYGRVGRCTGTRAFRREPALSVAGCAEARRSGGSVRPTGESRQPWVFLSFAESDQAMATRLGQNLEGAGIRTFDYRRSIAPSESIVGIIDKALTQSDYYVLLWSQASADSRWVNVEWTTAFMRELQEHRRSFLFVVRLDRTPVPLLLAARRYLDAFAGWDGVVEELVSTWRRDWAVRRNGIHVLPAPCSAATGGAPGSLIVLYIRNRDLSVEHVLALPEQSTGAELDSRVREGLALKNSVTAFGGKVGMRFFYRLEHAGKPISPDTAPLVELGITDGATITLEVQLERFDPGGSSPIGRFRRGSPKDFPPATTRYLINLAFGHLLPW